MVRDPAHLYCNLFLSAKQTEDSVIQMLISSWQHHIATLSRKQYSSADEAGVQRLHLILLRASLGHSDCFYPLTAQGAQTSQTQAAGIWCAQGFVELNCHNSHDN